MKTMTLRLLLPTLALASLTLCGCAGFSGHDADRTTCCASARLDRESRALAETERRVRQISRDDKFLTEAISLIRDRCHDFDREPNPLRRQTRIEEVLRALDTFERELDRQSLETEDARYIRMRLERHRGEWREIALAHRESLTDAADSVLREHAAGKALEDLKIAERIYTDARSGFWNDDEEKIIRALVHLRRVYADERVMRHLDGNTAIVEPMQHLRHKCCIELNDDQRARADSDRSLPGYPEQTDWPERPTSTAYDSLRRRYNAAFTAATA